MVVSPAEKGVGMLRVYFWPAGQAVPPGGRVGFAGPSPVAGCGAVGGRCRSLTGAWLKRGASRRRERPPKAPGRSAKSSPGWIRSESSDLAKSVDGYLLLILVITGLVGRGGFRQSSAPPVTKAVIAASADAPPPEGKLHALSRVYNS